MNTKRLRFLLYAIPVCLISVLLIGAQKSRPANAGGVIDPTCVSSLPCIEYDNSSTGPGVRGISVVGNGLAGATKVNAFSAANGRSGVFGKDDSTSGNFNSGVHGLSAHGTGVLGESTLGAGVSGSGSTGVVGSGTYGVVGNASEFVGVFGSGPVGVAGKNTSSATSDALAAFGLGGRLFRGRNSHSVDVFTVDDGGNMNLTGNSTVAGHAAINGVAFMGTSLSVNANDTVSMGIASQGTTIGVQGVGEFAGVEGVNSSNSSSHAVLALGFGGFLYGSSNSASHDVFHVDDAGNVHAHSFTADLAAATGQKVVTYAPQSSEPTIEDFGEAQLTNGAAYIHIDSRFAATMARGLSYLVFITPEGDDRGLYVSQKSADGFAVRESQGGHSSLAFSYRIVAKPFGTQAPRLPLFVEHRVPRYLPRLHN